MDIRWIGFGVLATVNAILLAVLAMAFISADVGVDWMVYDRAGELGDLYAVEPPYRYSPLLAYVFAVIPGYPVWAALHFAALALLPWRMALIALVSFPFWADVYHGNTMTFVFVAAYLALSGSRWATWAFMALAVLMPRPLMLPVLAWILWQRPEWRVPFATVAAAVLAGSLLTGQGVEWLWSLTRTGQEFGGGRDLGPAVLLGVAWVPVGLALGAWLTWRGRLGLASLAVSPYWLAYYLLMPVLELRRLGAPPSMTRPAASPR